MNWINLEKGDIFEYIHKDGGLSDITIIGEVLDKSHKGIRIQDHLTIDGDVHTNEVWSLTLEDGNTKYPEIFIVKKLVYHRKATEEILKVMYPEYYL